MGQVLYDFLSLSKGFAERTGDPAAEDFFQFLVAYMSEAPLEGREAEWNAAQQPVTPAETAAARMVGWIAAYARDHPDEKDFVRHVELVTELATRFVRFEGGAV